MCGFAGYLGSSAQSNGEFLEKMGNAIARRGPDDSGIWFDVVAGIGLSHRRLAILDLSPAGHQPMQSANGRYVIAFNGEVYNYLILRKELAGCGHRFKGSSDTEVVLTAFSQWGIESTLKKLVGMFAFGLWDRQERTLYLVRDRMGEKPLYYGWSGSAFLFGSELKALCAHPQWRGEIDRDVLSLFFRLNYVPTPYSIYKGIYKLLPGTYLQVSVDGLHAGYLPTPINYWSLQLAAEEGTMNPFEGTDKEAIEELHVLLKSAVAGQIISDVPIGAFLSGGIDSSLIVALMQAQSSLPVKTFTIGFDDVAYNEAEYAKAVAEHLGTEHNEIYVTPQQAIAVIPRLPELYDEPFADSSQIPTFLVSQFARQSVTVSLSGDGGDEVFCGYNRHVFLNAIWAAIGWMPKQLRGVLAAALRACPEQWTEAILRRRKFGVLSDQIQKLGSILGMDTPELMYRRLTSFWDNPTALVSNSIEPPTLLSERHRWPILPNVLDVLLYLESVTSLPDDMLVKLDRAAMGVSLETRMPLLDHRVVEFSWRLPLSMKLRNGVGKWILRQVLYQYVPRSLIERPKSGFGIPIDTWLKGPLRPWAEDLLDENRLRREGYLNPGLVREKWTEQLSGRHKWHPHLWGVLMFEAWLECRQNS